MRKGLSYVCLKCVLVSYVLSYESYHAVLSSAPARQDADNDLRVWQRYTDLEATSKRMSWHLVTSALILHHHMHTHAATTQTCCNAAAEVDGRTGRCQVSVLHQEVIVLSNYTAHMV
jgi:hypothetical protein